LTNLINKIVTITVDEPELVYWKKLLPAMAERCRDWEHTASCEYAKGIPASLEEGKSSICSCGGGKVEEEFLKEMAWKDFIPHITRVAIAPIFPVPYLESTTGLVEDITHGRSADGDGRPPQCDGEARKKCQNCKKTEGVKACAACGKVGYCSRACQRGDWKTHKLLCQKASP
jgi:MYND finger